MSWAQDLGALRAIGERLAGAEVLEPEVVTTLAKEAARLVVRARTVLRNAEAEIMNLDSS